MGRLAFISSPARAIAPTPARWQICGPLNLSASDMGENGGGMFHAMGGWLDRRQGRKTRRADRLWSVLRKFQPFAESALQAACQDFAAQAVEQHHDLPLPRTLPDPVETRLEDPQRYEVRLVGPFLGV